MPKPKEPPPVQPDDNEEDPDACPECGAAPGDEHEPDCPHYDDLDDDEDLDEEDDDEDLDEEDEDDDFDEE